ncbi:hypothetical protein ASD23_01090 [Agromyces sp. Root1464]|uniref:Gfo/Idh/MocA family protein n=1 Tax=Agromyces sp. Root1464 TaxID=1736467 RepID=UPI0006FE1F33|nr:Gfo/Idh/MocA family oxidoreductase [Agromyces sp. Root1464]KQZ10792.1 hypothetical protein ASD23_01090 [Agromyces sp. Root1464]
MTKTQRVAFIGLSHYHATDWVAAVAAHPHAELVGVWDRDAVLRARFAAGAGTTAWDSREALLADADVVAIASVTSDHRDDAVAAAEAGCHLLLEKPPTADLASFAAVRQAVEASGVVFAQNLPKRLDPASLAVRRLVAAGELGPIASVRIRHGHWQAWDDGFRSSWFTDPVAAGAGALLDEGIHTLDFCRWLLGEPDAITAHVSSATGLAVEDTAVITVQYRRGPIVSITTSWSMAGASGSIEVHGRDATIDLGGVDMASRGLSGESLLRRVARRSADAAAAREWEDLGVVPVFSSGGFHGLGITDLLDALAEGRDPAAGLDDAEAALRLVEAAYESARTGRMTWLS